MLGGVVVAARRDTPATAMSVRHLTRLGAELGAVGEADVLLEAEEHTLLGGGLVGSETTAQASLGLTDYIGPFGEEPARTGCDLASAAAGFCGALASLAALRGTERPVRVAVSPMRALAALKTIIWAARTRPDAWTGTHVRSRERLVDSGYETRDGRVTLDFPFTGHDRWRAFVETLELPPAIVESYEPRWYETVGWGDDVDEARPVYESHLRERSTDEAVALIRAHGGSSVPFQTVEQCLSHPQSEALGLRDAVARGLPWSTVGGKARSGPTRVIDPARPLAGLRVVDFGVGGVGPFSATLLAWLGADVIKVEAPNEFILAVRPLVDGVGTTYLAINQGKRSVRLDLKNEEDHAVARSLVATADVVMENFRPGALERVGLGYHDVRALNASVVYCSVTGFGSKGPLAGEPCTDPHMQAFSGFAATNADRDGVPRRVRYYAIVDLVTSCVVAEAACAGLILRDAGGESVHVETSMLQAISDVLGAPGERCVPDAIFRTADGHIALTCTGDAAWRQLVDVLGSRGLQQASFARQDGRAAHREQVEREVGEALRRLPSAAWAHSLGRAGIACARVARDEEVIARKDLWDDGILRTLPTPTGSLVAGGPPWRLEPEVTAPGAPHPGEHTDRVRANPERAWL